jgi:uncharacterized protein YhhL (DUF1145 family)
MDLMISFWSDVWVNIISPFLFLLYYTLQIIWPAFLPFAFLVIFNYFRPFNRIEQ